MYKTIHKEKFKTTILVVLFISTVLLSYFYLKDTSFYNFKENVSDHLFSSAFYDNDIPDVSDLVYPDSIKINYGDGTYSVFQENYENIWNELTNYYIEMSNSEDIIITEISSDLWAETMDMKSVQYFFNYNLPIDYFEIIGASDYGAKEYFNCVSTIAYSEASKSSIFVHDSSEDKYYRIVYDCENENIINEIENLKLNKTNQYYPAYMILGTDNESMIPFSTDIDIPEISVPTENKSFIQSYEKDIANVFFGESLDFIRKITDDSGTITYMYGIGQKILTIYNDGKFEYQEESDSDSENINFKKAISTSLLFIANHGSWSSYDGKELNLKLIDVEINKNSQNIVYKFTFDENYKNYPIYNANTSKIKIEITGSSVTYYSRNIQIHAPHEIDSQNENEETLKNKSLTDILSMNYNTIDQTLQNYGITDKNESEMKIFDRIVNNITNVEAGYFSFSSDESNNYFKPAWILSFSEIKMFFDLYTGEYLGYSD